MCAECEEGKRERLLVTELRACKWARNKHLPSFVISEGQGKRRQRPMALTYTQAGAGTDLDDGQAVVADEDGEEVVVQDLAPGGGGRIGGDGGGGGA